MLQYMLYIILPILGFAIAYFVLKSKNDQWKKGLDLITNHLASSKKTAIDESNQMPAEIAPLAKQINLLIHQKQNSEPAKAAPEKAPVDNALVKKQLNNTLIINELGQRITSSLHLKETFDHLFTTLNSMMDAAVVELAVYHLQKEEWSIYSNLNCPKEYANHFSEWTHKNNRAIFLSDVEKDFGRYVNEPLELSNKKMAKSMMSFPVLYDNKGIGTISVMSYRNDAFDEYHKESIEHLLGFIAVAMENAFTHENLNLLKIRAEESEKHEQQFLANMSHEIRTPMNAVLGMTNLLLDTKLDEKQIRYLKAINISSKNLLVIINDILDLSKLEAGKMEIEKIPFRIRDVIQNVNDTSRFKAEEKGLLFEININPDLPEVVKGDPTRLNQIITNLCSNAIKFTEKGKITISVDKAADSNFIRFRVIDTGIGIPNDKIHLLFSNFKQVDSSTFRKYGGTGLGLSISKTLIELQGGKVEVKSQFGKGSEFSVQIPYALGTEEDVKAIDQVGPADYSSLEGIRILVAEDNEYNQIVINDTLESLIKNLTIDIAENGKIALDMLQKNKYDIILMDAQMPEMDGLEATRQIRKLNDKIKSNIPIFALTASVHKADIDKCINAGMNSFIPKPFTREELMGTIAKFYHNPNPSGKNVNSKPDPKNIETLSSENMKKANHVTDLTFLEEFAEGNKDRMKKYIQLYLKLLPDNIKKIAAANDAANHVELVKVIHAMRPHLKYMGMEQASILAAQIEHNVHEVVNLDEIEQMANTILADCKLSQQELESLLAA
jgi:signal transduction histidine kinase/response regulator RpfG family c-di-GMP phosphodiesterase